MAMTREQIKDLPDGTCVRWREGQKSPRAGELTDWGRIQTKRVIIWSDGQETELFDDSALGRVELA